MGLLSEQREYGGWNDRVRPKLANTNITIDSTTNPSAPTLLIRMPDAIQDYSITEPETLFLTLPPSAVSSAAPIRVYPPLVITAERRTARFGGHLVEEPEEATLRSDVLSNLTIVLEDDVWAAEVGQPHLGQRELNLQNALISSLVSQQNEPGGWLEVVQAGLHPEHVHRLDDKTMLIDLHQYVEFEIRAPETIVALVPPEAVLSRVSPVFLTPLVIQPSIGRARLSGSLLRLASEESVRDAGTLELSITLTGDEWGPNIGRQGSEADMDVARTLLAGIVPSLNLPTSWASIVQPGLTPMVVSRSGPSTVVVEVPQFLAYDIDEPETLTVTVPGSALLSSRPIVATPPMRILASNGTVQVGGSLLSNPSEGSIRDIDAPSPVIRLDVCKTPLLQAWA